MKRTLALFLLLCLLLAGCGLTPPEETPPPSYSLPVPEPPGTELLRYPETIHRPAAAEEDDSDPDSPSADDSEPVTVHQEERLTRIENKPLWDSFLAAMELGEECEVRLQMLYEGGKWELTLRYDGEVFLLDDGTVGIYRYLIADEDSDPPAGAAWRRATHYLLSEDPEMSWDRYFSRMVSSSIPSDAFPATSSLFTVYE